MSKIGTGLSNNTRHPPESDNLKSSIETFELYYIVNFTAKIYPFVIQSIKDLKYLLILSEKAK